MKMTKEDIIEEIRRAFKDVKLEDGIGLWEAQGLDDYADGKTMKELRKKDERNDWDKIEFKDLQYCSSSLSFFDAKGMLFHLPKFMLLDLNQDNLGINITDGVTFVLGHQMQDDYQKKRFSLFNRRHAFCVIHFLKYKMYEIRDTYNKIHGVQTDQYLHDFSYQDNLKALKEWQKRI